MDWASQEHTFATLGSSKIVEHIEFLALKELEEAKSSVDSVNKWSSFGFESDTLISNSYQTVRPALKYTVEQQDESHNIFAQSCRSCDFMFNL